MGQLTRLFAVIMFFPLLAACEDEQAGGRQPMKSPLP